MAKMMSSHFSFWILLLGILSPLVVNIRGEAEIENEWRIEGRIQHALKSAECPKENVGHIARVFLSQEDVPAALAFLQANPKEAVGELRALCQGLKLQPRAAAEGVHANGRVVLLWYDLAAKGFHSSVAEKQNEFVASRDRLAAAVVILDTRAINRGGWVEAERVKLSLPPSWVADKADGGFALMKDLWIVAGSVLDPRLAGVLPSTFGHVVAEPRPFGGGSRTVNSSILDWVLDHPNETVALLVVYQYDGNDPRIVSGYRLYAADSSGKFVVVLATETLGPGDWKTNVRSIPPDK